ncbi:MAG TPA: hypothetical protein VGK73_02955 [Polyangiaceae bacterium]
MRKQISSVLVFASLVGGCATAAVPPAAPLPAPKPAVVAPPAETAAEAPAPSVLERRVGDYVVHMISGSFRKQPAMFTERVVGRENDAWVIELKLEDNQGAKVLRAWIDEDGAVQKLTRVTEKGEVPAKPAEYDALLASISLTPDENEGLTASTMGTCTVGPAELECETKSYRVRLGDKEASLGITQSASIPGNDVSGEIRLSDGTLIFRSELVERGNENTPDDSFALLSEPDAGPSAK